MKRDMRRSPSAALIVSEACAGIFTSATKRKPMILVDVEALQTDLETTLSHDGLLDTARGDRLELLSVSRDTASALIVRGR